MGKLTPFQKIIVLVITVPLGYCLVLHIFRVALTRARSLTVLIPFSFPSLINLLLVYWLMRCAIPEMASSLQLDQLDVGQKHNCESSCMTKINFDAIENICVDCVLGFGPACRVAAGLKRHNLRYFANPFDYMMCYQLDDVISLLSSRGQSFFADCRQDARFSCANTIGIIDVRTGMVSMHDHPATIPVKYAPLLFRLKYRHRFRNLDSVLKRADRIGVITYRAIDFNVMQDFISKFKSLYQPQHIYFIDIRDTPEESFSQWEADGVTYLQYCFDDQHIGGRDKKTNPAFWLGRVDYWDNILKKISINKDFVADYMARKRRFNVSYTVSQEGVWRMVTILGNCFRRKISLGIYLRVDHIRQKIRTWFDI